MMRTWTVLALAVACVFPRPLGAAERKTYPMNVSAEGVQKIVFEVQEGDFVLRGDPGAKEIRMMVSIDRMWIFKLGEQDILKRLITVSGQGTPQVSIRTDIPHGISSFGRAEYPIDFEVVVPDHANIEVRDSSGKIEVANLKGDLAIQDESGTVGLRNLGGTVVLRKKSGDVKIADVAGALTIDSQSGQMDIRRVGALDIRDADGNLTFTEAVSAHVSSRGGNLRVSDVKGDLSVDNQSGEIEISRIAGNVDVRDTSGQIRVEDTGPLRIQDTSGDITVHRAASLDVTAKESGQIKASGITGSVRAPAGFEVIQKTP